MDANTIARDLFQTVVYSALPERGNPTHSQYELSAEDIDLIETENLETLFLQKDWTDTCEWHSRNLRVPRLKTFVL